tara:strand:- start:1680 stop:1826 length:147 start_codon:yes stop_codon:yes gene_type:complete
MLHWNPSQLKELRERGYKIKVYDYDPRYKEKTIEELEEEQNEKHSSDS